MELQGAFIIEANLGMVRNAIAVGVLIARTGRNVYRRHGHLACRIYSRSIPQTRTFMDASQNKIVGIIQGTIITLRRLIAMSVGHLLALDKIVS